MGNICRSPSAEGYFRKIIKDQGLEEKIEIDSAGTHAYHVGESPDPRSVKAASKRDVDLSYIRARQVTEADFNNYDFVLAMDHQNHDTMLNSFAPKNFSARLSLFLDFSNNYKGKAVPDPYYGGVNGFENVLDLIEEASTGLLNELKKNYL